jgi:hypothetical protein
MGNLVERLQVFHKKQGISAEDFHCCYYSSCKSGYIDFTEAKGTFVSSGYEKSIPRLLFISLDPGREDFYRHLKNRTLLNVQKHEMERDITKLKKNRHWYRTVEFACTILKRFKKDENLQINQATQYFAHINTVKCCVNNPGNRKADYRLFKNCKSFVPQEVEILNPNIIVTQGNEARQTIAEHYKTHDPSNYLINLSLSNELKILYMNNHPVLWIHTFHPSNYGQFNKINYKNYNLYAEIAFKFIEEVHNYQKESKRIKIEPKEVKTMTSNCFTKYSEIVENIIGELDRNKEHGKPFPWFCKDIFRKNDLQWAGYIGFFSKQENALVFGINIEHKPAWERVFPHIREHADSFSELLSKLVNMKWHWWGIKGKIRRNPPRDPQLQHEEWTSEVVVNRWLEELENILNRKKLWWEDNKTHMRPQLQIMRLVGTCDQLLLDEDLIKHNIQQTIADLKPITSLFR